MEPYTLLNDTQSSQYNTKLVIFSGINLSIQEVTVNQFYLLWCKSTMKRQKKDNSQKDNGFACRGHRQLVSPYPSSLILLQLRILLVSLSLLVARWYLQPNQVAQVFQRRQNGTAIRAVTRRCIAQSQEHGGDIRRLTFTQGEADRAIEGHQPSSRTGIRSFV